MQSFKDILAQYDHTIWLYMNVKWHNGFFDVVMPYLREQWFWAPLYLFLLIFMPAQFGRRAFLWCLAFLICFAIGDQVSAHMIKPFMHRLRPCNDPNYQNLVHLLVPCGSGFSFPSSHATNHFAMGIFSAVTLQKYAKWIWPVAIFWAASIAYAQVYVGVHFPVDIFGGALIGTAIGLVVGFVFNRFIKLRQ
jgi:undecaprenyl-diphosphatase